MKEADFMRRCMKSCTVCGEQKDTSCFPVNKLGTFGVGSWCKPCFAAKARQKYAENREKEIARSAAWNKRNARRVADNMNNARLRRPEHFKQYRKDYVAENPDRSRIWDARRRVKRTEAIANSAGVSIGEWEAIKLLHDYCCAYCGSWLRPLQMDHIVPLARGGSHCSGNIAPACKPCNNSKNATSLAEWAKRTWVVSYVGS